MRRYERVRRDAAPELTGVRELVSLRTCLMPSAYVACWLVHSLLRASWVRASLPRPVRLQQLTPRVGLDRVRCLRAAMSALRARAGRPRYSWVRRAQGLMSSRHRVVSMQVELVSVRAHRSRSRTREDTPPHNEPRPPHDANYWAPWNTSVRRSLTVVTRYELRHALSPPP